MTLEKDLLEFTHKFREVRGRAPRRLYLTLDEWRTILISQRYVAFPSKSDMHYDGALMIKSWNNDVVHAIRAWDLLPYGSEP